VNGLHYQERISLRGHIIDSLILPRVFDTVMDMGGDFVVEEISVGTDKRAPSYARLAVSADTEERLNRIITTLQGFGAELISAADVKTEPSPRDGVLPSGFYSTTNLPTEVRLRGAWVAVSDTEMDLVIVVDWAAGKARNVPMADVRRGDAIVVGHDGIRVIPMERERQQDEFSFMQSAVSSERSKTLAIAAIGREMREVRQRGEKVIFVVGPAVIHTGAGAYLAAMVREGYVQALFGGNAIATHDVESALFGTSLGLSLRSGAAVEGGHQNHMRAINAIRGAGSLREAVEQGVLTKGLMYECMRANVELVLAGSIRDDGPMPDVITDVIQAQRAMRVSIRGAGLVIMVSTMLHSIAVGNLLPAAIRVAVVDINPAVVTKLADRGSFQAVGLVTDAELFLRELCDELGLAYDGECPPAAPPLSGTAPTR
jgi:lysine-ketoglutarate reductase/saccharopine dehydrogenase-like protein (TIGR00300 family)